MSIEDIQVIDIISTDLKDGSVTLVATDHLEWGSGEHLLTIQEKLNCYLSYIESGEVYESYPNAKGHEIKIQLACKYQPDDDAVKFLRQCEKIIDEAGFKFSYRVHEN